MKAATKYRVHPLIEERWSPYLFDSRPVEPEKLAQLFEAARLAPSSYNEQPWSYVIAHRGTEEFDQILSTLVEPNRVWAEQAPLLGISVARMFFERNHKPNAHAFHDVGLSMGSLILQAVDLGLAVHQMSGFHPDQAATVLKLPDEHQAVAAFAIGYPGDPAGANPELAERDAAHRGRKEQSEFLFVGEWGKR